MSLVSYVPKKNRSVILLSTMHNNNNTDINNKNKSEINIYYNKTKGGVDTLDQMAHAFTTRRKTNRWPVAQFFNLIDICGIASSIIWIKTYPNWNSSKQKLRRRLFLRDLVQDMVIPNIQRRSLKYLSKTTVTTINNILQNSSKTIKDLPKPKNMRRRCHICEPTKCRMSTQCCSQCEKNICNEHSEKIIICNNCKN